MKNTITALALTVCMSTLALGAEPIEYVPTPGESSTVVSPTQEEASTGFSVEIFPKEIYLGDTIYLTVYYENRSNDDVSVYTNDGVLQNHYSSKQIWLSTPTLPGEYHWIPERPSIALSRLAGSYKTVKPGEKYPVQKISLQFPPLEDWNDQFWQTLRRMIRKEDAACQLHIKRAHFVRTSEKTSPELVCDVLVKARSLDETAFLERWFKDTPKTLLPEIDRDRKVPYSGSLESSNESNITINGEEYNPWYFIRLGYRKPSEPNNPTSLEGWRELEASLTPSTMRDEIRFTRLQLEYYSAEQGEASDQAMVELIDWLNSLPEVQRTAMTTFLVSTRVKLYETPLRAKNRELLRTIYDMLDVCGQKAVCNFESLKYNDRTLTPPPGVKVSLPPSEFGKPTAEDLAYGSKDLPDGFYIWDANADGVPTKHVARYVELRESNNVLVLKNREGRSFNMVFSMVSEEDKEHARAMSQAAAEKPEEE
jgi:hypothetical protein